MRLSTFNKIIAPIAFVASVMALPTSASASSDKFNCRQVNGVYGVYSRVSRGDIELMEFSRDVNQEWSIVSRCEEVAIRFQRYYDNGILRYIGAGYLNSQPVLCAIAAKDGVCSDENLLVTLPPNTEPVNSARLLMDTRGLAQGRVISVSGSEKIEVTTDNGNTYFDLEALEQAILEKADSDRFIPFGN